LDLVKHTTYFQIEPSAVALATFPSVLVATEADILLQPVLTSRSWADRSAWCQETVAMTVKLLYLARVREYEFLSSSPDARRVLGSDDITTQVFDRWWTIREMPWEEPSEHWECYLAAVSKKVEATGRIAVDDLLHAILERQATGRRI
jgi:hypothetical protein